MKTRSLASTAALAATMLLASCSGDREGGDCERCRDADPRCDSGFTCTAARYEGGTLSGLPTEVCMRPNQTECKP